MPPAQPRPSQGEEHVERGEEEVEGDLWVVGRGELALKDVGEPDRAAVLPVLGRGRGGALGEGGEGAAAGAGGDERDGDRPDLQSPRVSRRT